MENKVVCLLGVVCILIGVVGVMKSMKHCRGCLSFIANAAIALIGAYIAFTSGAF